MDAKKTGKFICTLRKEKGLTQAVLAETLNISNRTVSKWENGDGFPDITILPDIAETLGVTVDELLEGKRKSEVAEIKVTEIENKDNVDNIFQITFIISVFFGLFAAILGCITEIYNTWAFNILFYNHWEILFVVISFCAEIVSGLVFAVGVTRLGVSYSKTEIISKVGKRAWCLSILLTMLPIAFIIRIVDCSHYTNYKWYVFIILVALIASVFLVLYKKFIK
ncbi:MAG: helix-turn-helix domain-containing protein [Eubacterium sp.]